MSIKRMCFDKSNYQGLIDLADKLKGGNLQGIMVTVIEDTSPSSITQGNNLSYDFLRLQMKIDELFNSNMVKELSWYKKELRGVGLKELKDGAIEWAPLSRKLRRYITPLRCLNRETFFEAIAQELKPLGIHFMDKEEALERYGHRRKVLIKR